MVSTQSPQGPLDLWPWWHSLQLSFQEITMCVAEAAIFFDTQCSTVIVVKHCIYTIFIQCCFSCSISLTRVQVSYIGEHNKVFTQHTCNQLQDKLFICNKGASKLASNLCTSLHWHFFPAPETEFRFLWLVLSNTDGDATMLELEGSPWHCGTLCLCWVADWATRLAKTFLFSSFWLDWHKAKTCDKQTIPDRKTKRTRSDGKPAQENTWQGEKKVFRIDRAKWKVMSRSGRRQIDHSKFQDLNYMKYEL